MGSHLSTVVGLRDLVDREVLCVDSRLQLGLEWSADAAQLIPDHTAEEWMLLNFGTTTNAA